MRLLALLRLRVAAVDLLGAPVERLAARHQPLLGLQDLPPLLFDLLLEFRLGLNDRLLAL